MLKGLAITPRSGVENENVNMAVTFTHLYEQICDAENLWRAYQKARRGKRYGEPAARFELRAEENILALRAELQAERWQPGAYRHFYIREPKKRLISAAPFRDRVVHHALVNVLEPIWEARFSNSSFACRKGKGTLAALLSAHWGIRNHPWFLKGDIVKFFPSVDHEVLMNVLGRKIADPAVLRLIRVILDSGRGILDGECPPLWFPGDDLFAPATRARGLPIGNLTSQFFANVLLNELDQFIHAEVQPRHYVRYADDFVLFDADREKLAAARAAITARLERLRLRPHAGKTHLRLSGHGLRFLGFRLLPQTRRLDRGNISRFRRRMKRLGARRRCGMTDPARITLSIKGWLAHAAHGNTHALVRKVLADVRT